jgi:hypothetical protein
MSLVMALKKKKVINKELIDRLSIILESLKEHNQSSLSIERMPTQVKQFGNENL